MAWNELGEPIPGHRDELLARVTRRGERLRQRRRVAWGAATMCAVLAVVVPAVAWSGSDGRRARAVTTSGGLSSSDTTTAAIAADGTATPPALPADATVPNGGSSGVKPPVAPLGRPTATTTAPPVSQPPPPVPDGGGTSDAAGAGAPQPLPRCTNADLVATATTDKTSYAPGEVVKITGSLTNQSSQTCVHALSLSLEVRDAGGRWVYGFATHADYIAGREPTLAPGQSTPTLPAQWDQVACTEGCTPAPPGDYTIVADVMYGAPTMVVTIRPA